MTVIVADGRHGVMVSDSMMSDEQGGHARCGKIVPIRGMLAGAAGHSGACVKFLRWLRTGGKHPDFAAHEEFCALVLEKSGRIRNYEHSHEFEYLAEPYYAIGVGSQAALAAMDAGATAYKAVRICISRNIFCGSPIQQLRLAPNSRKPKR